MSSEEARYQEEAGETSHMEDSQHDGAADIHPEELEAEESTIEPMTGEPPLSPPATASPPPSATFKKPLKPYHTQPQQQQARRGQFQIATTAASRNREAATRRHDVPDARNYSPLSSPASSQHSFRRGATVPDSDGHFMSSTFASRQKMWGTKEGPNVPEGQRPQWR